MTGATWTCVLLLNYEKERKKKSEITRSTDLSTMSNSHVSDCGKLGIVCWYDLMYSQIAKASFLGTNSRNVVSTDPSVGFTRYRTLGNSWKDANIQQTIQMRMFPYRKLFKKTIDIWFKSTVNMFLLWSYLKIQNETECFY